MGTSRARRGFYSEPMPPKKTTAEKAADLKTQIGKLQAQLKKLEKQMLPDDSPSFPKGTKRRALADQLKKLGAIDVAWVPNGIDDLIPKNSIVAYFKSPRE